LTLVSYQVVAQLQTTTIDRDQQISFRGLSRSSQGLTYRLEVSLDGEMFFLTKVIAIPDDIMQGEITIGSNILNNCFLGSQQKLN
jgi:hypothetical protein